jgi:serine palmitoyltransferase
MNEKLQLNGIKKLENKVNESKIMVNESKIMVNEEAPYHIVLLCYLSYVVLIIFGYFRDFLRNTGLEKNKTAVERNREVFNLKK